jgi:hypothetical protein
MSFGPGGQQHGSPKEAINSGWLLPVGDVDGHVKLLVAIHGNRELLVEFQRLRPRRLAAQQMVDVYAATKATAQTSRAKAI